MSNLPNPGIASIELDEFQYDNKIVRNFAIATILFGLIGMLVGLLAAFQLVFPNLNMDLPYTTFSRIRPLHTNAVIFAFVGNGFFTGLILLGTKGFANTYVEPCFKSISLLGLAVYYYWRSYYVADGIIQRQGICRIGMAA